jgi:hypothetical protein
MSEAAGELVYMDERGRDLVPVEVALASVEAVLAGVDPDRASLAAQARLSAATLARRLAGRLDALASLLLAEADAAGASEQAAGTPLSSWLAVDQNLTRREAAGLVHRATELARHPVLGQAAAAGRVSAGQVRAIATVLGGIASQLDPDQQARAETLLVGLAGTLDSAALSQSAGRVLAQVAPTDADEQLETALQREAEAAHRSRSLRWWRQAGSVRFEGSLPRLEGEQLISLLDAHSEALRRTAVEVRDPLYGEATPEQRRADAFAHLLTHAAAAKPGSGIGTTRVIVKLDYDRLQRGAAGAGLLGDGTRLSAGELRRACCDAELVPVVLAGDSEPLDVGRRRRLVTAALRTALIARDGGCVFPACSAPPSACEAHHILPWWAGGRTSLSNLVLLCHHHHGVVEPAKHGIRDQWEVRIGANHLPEFGPPHRHPQAGQWLRHARHREEDRVAA